MPLKQDNALAAGLAGSIATALAYPFVPTAPRYYPIEHLWRWEKIAAVPSMGWYGHAFWALAVGVVVALLSAAILPRLSESMRSVVQRALQGALATAFPLALTLLALREFLWKAH